MKKRPGQITRERPFLNRDRQRDDSELTVDRLEPRRLFAQDMKVAVDGADITSRDGTGESARQAEAVEIFHGPPEERKQRRGAFSPGDPVAAQEVNRHG